MFTELLYKETKDAHKIVDRHKFVELIRNDKLAGDMYINFNKICINEIQKHLRLNDIALYKKLYKNISIELDEESIILPKILKHCENFPLESGYQFYLGILFGGNMLKNRLPEHTEFLTYENSKELIVEFKKYLCENVNEENYSHFIENVNKLYELINDLFNEYYERCERKNMKE